VTCERLGISRTTLWELRKRGELPCVRIGRLVRTPASAIDALIERKIRENEVASGAAQCHAATKHRGT
jgi:excisionase family DNA binding protein